MYIYIIKLSLVLLSAIVKVRYFPVITIVIIYSCPMPSVVIR